MVSNSWEVVSKYVLLSILLLCVDITYAAQENYLKVPALGRSAQLGYLYDERTDQFRDVNMFKRAIPYDMITTTQVPFTSIETASTDTFQDKFRLFHITASIAANILSGMIKIEGSAGYLKQEKESLLDVTGVLLYRSETVVQNLQAYYDGLKPIYNTDLLQNNQATHIVTGIKWGANIAVNFQDRATNDSYREEIQGHLRLEFEKLKAISIAAEATVDINGTELDERSKFVMSVQGDIQIPDKVPTTFREVQELMKQVPDLVKITNDGKGVPLEFTLTPLGPLKTHLKQQTEENNFANKLDESVLNDFIGIFDEISYCEQLLNDANEEIQSNIVCVLPEIRIKLIDLRSEFTKAKTAFTTKLKETLINVRTGNQSETALGELADSYMSSPYSAPNTEIKMHEFRSALEKIEFYKAIQNHYRNVEYFGSKNTLNARIISNLKEVIYVLFQNPKFMANDPQAWDDNSFSFFKTLNRAYNKLFVVDCDFDYPQCLPLNKTVIKQVINGRFTIQDVDAELKNSIELDSLSMKAIGRFARLGELYDARQDKFLGRTLLLPDHSYTLVESTEKQDWETVAVDSESIEDKFKALKISEESQFSILADLHPLSRSGQFLLKQEMNQAPNNIVSIAHIRHSGESELKILEPVFEESLDLTAVNRGEATHFVIKIEHGFNSIFSIENPTNDSSALPLPTAASAADVSPAMADFANNFRKLLDRIKVDNVTLNQVGAEDFEKLKPFHITVFSDTQGQESKPLPIDTADQLAEFINAQFIPRQFSQNSGKGQPLAYVLYPIVNLRKNYGVIRPPTNFDSVSSAGINPSEFVSLIEERQVQLEFANREIQELEDEINRFYYCTTNDDMLELGKIKERAAKLGGLKFLFKNIVADIKSTRIKPALLSEFLSDHRIQNVYTKNQSFVGSDKIVLLKETLNLCKRLEGSNIEYLGRKNANFSFNEIFSAESFNYSNKYFLYYKPSWIEDEEKGDIWRSSSQFFFGPLSHSNYSNWEYYVVNCEFDYAHCDYTTQPTIHEYRNGKLTTTNYEDYLAKEESSIQQQLNDLKELLRTEKDSLNKTLQGNSKSIESLSTRVETNKNSSTVNENDIRSLRSSVEINRGAITKNTNDISLLKSRMCDKRNVSKAIGCGGLIPIFSNGLPAYYNYNLDQAYGNSERCLWTLDNRQLVNSVYWRTELKLKITVECEGFADSGDTLSVVQWQRNNLVSSVVLRKLGDVYTSDKLYDSIHLSFSSNSALQGTGFVIKVESIATRNAYTGTNFYYSAASSLRTFGPYTYQNAVSIAININKPITFTVNSFDSLTTSTVCSASLYYDTFFVYQIGEEGVITQLLKLCGKRTSPVTVNSSLPILAVMETVTQQIGKQFVLSWS